MMYFDAELAVPTKAELTASLATVSQVRNSDRTPLLSLLLEGAPGAGKTALAATIGMDSEYPFVKVVSADNMVGFSEPAKAAQISKIFEDAYRVQTLFHVMYGIQHDPMTCSACAVAAVAGGAGRYRALAGIRAHRAPLLQHRAADDPGSAEEAATAGSQAAGTGDDQQRGCHGGAKWLVEFLAI